MRTDNLVRVLLLLLFCGNAYPAQGLRDDWRNLRHGLNLNLEYSLKKAPLSPEEREQIYRVVDDKTIHESFGDDERNKEREVVLSSRVGFVGLAKDGSRQLLVRGPGELCGATGNCSIWLFVRRHDRLQLVLTTGGNTFIVKPALHNRFHDLAIFWHASAFEGDISVYRWNGVQYELSDCYAVTFDRDNSEKPPKTEDCPHNPNAFSRGSYSLPRQETRLFIS